MKKQTLSLSFDIFTEPTVDLDKQHLLGQVTDLLAGHLATLTGEFDLQTRYVLLSREPELTPTPVTKTKIAKTTPVAFPVLNDDKSMVEMVVGSPEWFDLLEAKKFRYRYQGLTFSVRFETQTTQSGNYQYWRAFCRLNGKLVTRQVGKRDDLTKQKLDEVGAYFLNRQKAGKS